MWLRSSHFIHYILLLSDLVLSLLLNSAHPCIPEPVILYCLTLKTVSSHNWIFSMDPGGAVYSTCSLSVKIYLNVPTWHKLSGKVLANKTRTLRFHLVKHLIALSNSRSDLIFDCRKALFTRRYENSVYLSKVDWVWRKDSVSSVLHNELLEPEDNLKGKQSVSCSVIGCTKAGMKLQ